MQISPKSHEIVNNFCRYVEAGDKTLIEKYTLEELRIAKYQYVKDSYREFYKAIEDRIKELEEIDARKKNNPFWKDWKFWIAVIPIGGIATGLFLNWVFSIKTYKIHLHLPYAYEYSYEGATHNDQNRRVLSKVPIEIKLNGDNRGILRLGVHNANTKTIKRVTLHIYFREGIKVIGHNGWIVWEPNKVYYTLLKFDVPNEQTISIEPIFIEFLEPKIYKIQYSITGEDFKRIKSNFLIKAIK